MGSDPFTKFLRLLIRKTGKVKPQYQVIFTSTGVSLIIRASVSHRTTLPYSILNADLESLKHRLWLSTICITLSLELNWWSIAIASLLLLSLFYKINIALSIGFEKEIISLNWNYFCLPDMVIVQPPWLSFGVWGAPHSPTPWNQWMFVCFGPAPAHEEPLKLLPILFSFLYRILELRGRNQTKIYTERSIWICDHVQTSPNQMNLSNPEWF